MKIKAILTGATGMVGEGVLHECLKSEHVEAVLVITRKPTGMSHPKLREIIHSDFLDISPIASRLTGFNACYFCLGVSSVGMKAEKYVELTYTLTLNFAQTLAKVNPEMTFCYVSGAGTDSSEKGRVGWARVKGKTENDLMKLPFRQVFNFRPGVIAPTPGLKNTQRLYKYLGWLIPVIRLISANAVVRLSELGIAMMNVTLHGYKKQILEASDIRALGQ